MSKEPIVPAYRGTRSKYIKVFVANENFQILESEGWKSTLEALPSGESKPSEEPKKRKQKEEEVNNESLGSD